jgi:hypothetical protein
VPETLTHVMIPALAEPLSLLEDSGVCPAINNGSFHPIKMPEPATWISLKLVLLAQVHILNPRGLHVLQYMSGELLPEPATTGLF